MSWMDSWSRPSKQSAVPPPLYLTSGEDVPYCHTCGRVISSRKSTKNTAPHPVKYCSDRCRNRKPGPLDRRIEKAIAALLNGEDGSGVEKTRAHDRVVKGDHRLVITMDEVEEIVFGSRFDPEKVYGRRKNRKSRAIGGTKHDQWRSVDMESTSEATSSEDNEDGGGTSLREEKTPGPRMRPPQTQSEVNFSVGGERGRAERIEESATDAGKRQEGQKRAEEREMVRRAARRAVVFGLDVEHPALVVVGRSMPKRSGRKFEEHDTGNEPYRRKCEALMQGAVVEPSFAKGNWSIRWRE